MKRAAVRATPTPKAPTVITITHIIDKPAGGDVPQAEVSTEAVVTVVGLGEAPTVVKLLVAQALIRVIALERTRQ